MIARVGLNALAVWVAWRKMGTARLVRAYREHRAVVRARRHLVLADAAADCGDMPAARRHFRHATVAQELARRIADADGGAP